MMNLEILNEKILACKLCSLSLCRFRAVPGEGPCHAEIMLVGEAPGAEEDLTGKPFVGKAGRLLDKLLSEAGIERFQVFITSVVKCRPPGNRKPKSSEIETCLPYLRSQIDLINPKAICLMGNIASKAVLERQSVTSMHGKTFHDRFVVTFHPAAVLRNRNLREDFISDLKKVKRI